MWRCVLVALLGLVVPAQAITWNFDRAGDSQGWQARESAFSGASASTLSALPSEVREGVWRISLLPSVTEHAPSVVLVSPPIGHDSALFDRASLRFRVVHRQPIAGHFILAWTNQTNRATPGEWLSPVAGDTATAALLFRVGEEVTYTTAWQEIVVGDLRSGPVSERGIAYELHWEGDLIDIRFHLLFAADPWRGVSGRLEDVPEAVEIDRVVLTGAEEQLQGELPPPRIQETMSFGGLFAPAAFSPLGRKGIGAMGGFAVPFAVLGDLDDDHDLDLVTLVGPLGPSIEDGWLTALNDGHGKFEGSFFQSLPGPQGPLLAGADLDGNGRMDLVLGEGSQQVRVLYPTFRTSRTGFPANINGVI